MCQATAYLVKNGQETEIMHDVILVEPAGERVRLHTFFEEPVEVHARVGRIDFLKHRVMLESLEEGSDGDN